MKILCIIISLILTKIGYSETGKPLPVAKNVIKGEQVMTLLQSRDLSAEEIVEKFSTPLGFFDYGPPIGEAITYQGFGDAIYLFVTNKIKEQTDKTSFKNYEITQIRLHLNGQDPSEFIILWQSSKHQKAIAPNDIDVNEIDTNLIAEDDPFADD
jgi:hypothetical protein